ncbi:MAG: DsbA family oxidoreductase [Breznakibacter sp.]|nr:DsbA family oxidoreductase [Breznakibacter sp.]
MENHMVVEVWSDILCPFCYIGKRRLEQALHQFVHRERIEIVWKSFLLNPNQVTDPSRSIVEDLALHKGISLENAANLFTQVKVMAQEVDLEFNIDSMVVANSVKAHCLSHLAKEFDKQNDVEELLFEAHFTKGKNIDNIETLVNIGLEVGLAAEVTRSALQSNKYLPEVELDIYEAKQVGLRSVPYFAFNNRYSITGAQGIEAFSKTLEHAFNEWSREQSVIKVDIAIGKKNV